MKRFEYFLQFLFCNLSYLIIFSFFFYLYLFLFSSSSSSTLSSVTYNGTSASSTSTNTISNPSTSTSTNNNNNNNTVNGKSWNLLLDVIYRIFNVLVDNLSKREIILGDFNELLTNWWYGNVIYFLSFGFREFQNSF